MTPPSGDAAHFMQAAEALADALIQDPFYATITGDLPPGAPAPRDCLTQYFIYSIKEGERFGIVIVPAPDAYGAAVWLFPQESDIQKAMDREKKKYLSGLLGPHGLARYEAIISFMHPRARQLVPPASWYLSIAGVSPEEQGRGRGKRLLRPTLIEADHRGVCCYLETFNARNIRFYNRLGFAEVVSHEEPTTAARYWIMLRAARQD